MSTIKLHYWPVKARTHAIKAVCQAGGLQFEEVNSGDMSAIKEQLPFGQLPFMEDGDVKLAQSHAILRYCARKAGLSGDTDAEFALSEMLIEESADLFTMMGKANYAEDKPKAYTDLFAPEGPMAKHMQCLEKLLPGGASPFFKAGDKRLAGGVAIAATLDIAVALEPTLLDATPKLKAFFDAMMASPAFGNGLRDVGMYFARA